MTHLPTYTEIIALHKKHAPSAEALDLVLTHCQIVWDIAEQLIARSNLTINSDLVRVGCLLHDIGVYRLYLPNGQIDHAHYIKHGTEGHVLLKEEGFDEQICRFASCHTGVGLSEEEIIREGIPIPPADYLAQTTEEKLVMYADKFHTKTTPPKFMNAETYAEKLKQFGDYKVTLFKKFQNRFGAPDLELLAQKYALEII